MPGCGCATSSGASWRRMSVSCGATNGRALRIWRKMPASPRAAPASSPVFASGFEDEVLLVSDLRDRHGDTGDDDGTVASGFPLVAVHFVQNQAGPAPAGTGCNVYPAA